MRLDIVVGVISAFTKAAGAHRSSGLQQRSAGATLGLLNRPTKQIILAAGRAAGLPLELIHAGIAVMEGTAAKPAAVQPLLVNQATAARLLSVSRFTIRRLIADGKLHPVPVRGALR